MRQQPRELIYEVARRGEGLGRIVVVAGRRAMFGIGCRIPPLRILLVSARASRVRLVEGIAGRAAEDGAERRAGADRRDIAGSGADLCAEQRTGRRADESAADLSRSEKLVQPRRLIRPEILGRRRLDDDAAGEDRPGKDRYGAGGRAIAPWKTST